MAEKISIVALCLCIQEREKFWKDLSIQCESIGIKFYPCLPTDNLELAKKIAPYFKYGKNNKIDNRYRHALAFMSHYEMVYIAKENKLPQFLMLEDDAYITKRFIPVFNKLKDQIKKLDFDILYLGWWIGKEDGIFNNMVEFGWEKDKTCCIIPCKKSVGLHGAIINETAYETILNMKCVDCMDSQIGKSNLRSYAILPKIIHTKSIKSFMEEKVMHRKLIEPL